MTLSEHQQEIAERIASGTQYGGAGGAVIFGLSANEFAAISGVVIGLIGLIVNIYFKYKTYKLAEREAMRG